MENNTASILNAESNNSNSNTTNKNHASRNNSRSNSSNNIKNATFRRETSKVTKLSSEQVFKQQQLPQQRQQSPLRRQQSPQQRQELKVEIKLLPNAEILNDKKVTAPAPAATAAPAPTAAAAPVTTNNSNIATPTVQSKIPMKRSNNAAAPTKSLATPRNFQPPHMKSSSKVSLTIKELGGKKLDTNSSKLSFKNPNLAKAAQKPVSGLPTKCLTARSSNISRRSASTISCRSNRSQIADDSSSQTLPKVASNAGDHEMHNGLSARERVAENNKLKVFENLQKKLEDIQTEFMQKFEGLKSTAPEKLKSDYKFITMIRNDECKLIVKEDALQRIPKKLPAESINDLKERVKDAMDTSLLILTESLTNALTINDDFQRSLNLEETHTKIEKEQSEKLQDLYDSINKLCTFKDADSIDPEVTKMQKEIQDSKKSLLLCEKKLNDLKKTHAEELQALEAELKEKTDGEVIKKDIQITELHKKMRVLEKQNDKLKNTIQQTNEDNTTDQAEKTKLTEDLKVAKENIQNMNKKLNFVEQQLKEEKKSKAEQVESNEKLESDLEMAKKKIEELRMKQKGDNNNQQLLEEHKKELSQFKAIIESLEKDKQALGTQIEQMKKENNKMSDLNKKLKVAEDQIRDLQSLLTEREQQEQDLSETPPKECQTELAKLRQSESEKKREIDKLKVELSKAHFNICQLEEQIQRDQQLLEVRSELINSLQTNDNTHRIHLEEMYAQMGDKNNTINELNNELRTKSEEFRNLFTTLSTKQMELSRQEHMIKLLEESNDRSQMLRVKQEEKIGRMEEEIAHLKQTITIYQNNVLGTAGCKNFLFAPVTPGDNYNENYYYYASERKRKRRTDIKVKKYET